MQKFNISLGIVMIAFSLILIVAGFIINLDGDYKEPVIKLPNNDITISTTENNSMKKQNNKANYEGDIDYQINELRKEIEDNYSIKVFYGNDISSYEVGGLTAVALTDKNVIYSGLSSLSSTLQLFPKGMFQEIKNSGMPLNVYLVQSFSSDNVTGITEKKYNKAIISISLDYPFYESFIHEVYHYMEHYINKKGGRYSNWNNYNPSGFVYGTYDFSNVYTRTNRKDAYFVNDYAQSYDYEDRASTFEYMMADTKISALDIGSNIWVKAKVMCETIDYYFKTVNSDTTEYWERYIYS